MLPDPRWQLLRRQSGRGGGDLRGLEGGVKIGEEEAKARAGDDAKGTEEEGWIEPLLHSSELLLGTGEGYHRVNTQLLFYFPWSIV